MSCGDQDCDHLVGPTTVTYTVAGNGGQLPPNCTNRPLSVQERTYGSVNINHTNVPLSGFTLTREVAPPSSMAYGFHALMSCSEGFLAASNFKRIQWSLGPRYPAVAVNAHPHSSTSLKAFKRISMSLYGAVLSSRLLRIPRSRPPRPTESSSTGSAATMAAHPGAKLRVRFRMRQTRCHSSPAGGGTRGECGTHSLQLPWITAP